MIELFRHINFKLLLHMSKSLLALFHSAPLGCFVAFAGAAEPVVLKDLAAGASNSFPRHLYPIGSTLFFTADGDSGDGLWKTDGTPEGTVFLKALDAPSTYMVRAALGNQFIFSAGDATHGNELWKSDGTAAGTVMIKDINPGTFSGIEQDQRSVLSAVIGNTLFFQAYTAGGGRELWMTDGTEGGTRMVKDLAAGASNSFPRHLYPIGSTLFFTADGDGGDGLWKTDGTPEGTVFLKALDAPSTYMVRAALGNQFIFSAGDATHGNELWKSDGTAAGTVMIKDINPGTFSGIEHEENSVHSAVIGNTLFFQAYTPTVGQELWSYSLNQVQFLPGAVSIQHAGTRAVISFTAEAAGFYQLQRSGDLTSWSTIDSETVAAGAVALFEDAQPPGTKSYYRIARP